MISVVYRIPRKSSELSRRNNSDRIPTVPAIRVWRATTKLPSILDLGGGRGGSEGGEGRGGKMVGSRNSIPGPAIPRSKPWRSLWRCYRVEEAKKRLEHWLAELNEEGEEMKKQAQGNREVAAIGQEDNRRKAE